MTTIKATLTRLTMLLAALAFAGADHAASIAEPATVFYGKIFSLGAQPYLVTEGQLTWIVRRSDGNNLVLRAPITSLNNGEYSYRLNVPHEALSPGLELAGGEVPLGAVETTQSHLQIVVNGRAARIVGGGSGTFDVSQARRSATYRLDLQVVLGFVDADGDGLPDGWEERFGVDDPNADPDGDGWNNLTEFRNRSNPTNDNRVPTLVTREIRAYADGTTAVLLRALDSDSGPTNLTYTLLQLPQTGTLALRNTGTPGSPDGALAVGATFTQAEVNRGRLVFTHRRNDPIEPTSFMVSLRDENPSHASCSNRVFVLFYRPGRAVALADVLGASNSVPARLTDVPLFSADEQSFVMSYVLSRDMNYVVSDAGAQLDALDLAAPSSGLTSAQYTSQYVPSFGSDRHHVFVGGPAADRISGSMETDVIVGGPGNDMLRGNGGADLFVLISSDDGNDTIEDFEPAQDTIDISHALTGTSKVLTNYLQLSSTSSNSTLRINSSGTGAPYNNLLLTLNGVSLTQNDLFNLVENGRIVTGGRALASRVSIVTSITNASENGPVSGEFTLTRSGSLEADLAVNLQITGSAGNGTDYRYVPPQVVFPAGQRSITIQITPYEDAAVELNEVVDIVVLSGAGYEVTTSSHAVVVIADLMPQIAIEALEPTAVKASQSEGLFLITRSGILDRSVFVRLLIGGTAANGTDYQSVSAFVNLLPQQTTALISILPKPTAVLSNGAEYVQVSIRPDPAYRVDEASVARVTIVEELLDLSLWRDRYFAGATGDLATFAGMDTGGTGIRNLHRYAFGLNPINPQASPGMPEFKVRDNRLTVAFRRPVSITQVQYSVEVSDDLVTWHSGNQWWESFVAPEYANNIEMVCYRSKQTISETPKLFMRVRVLYAP